LPSVRIIESLLHMERIPWSKQPKSLHHYPKNGRLFWLVHCHQHGSEIPMPFLILVLRWALFKHIRMVFL